MINIAVEPQGELMVSVGGKEKVLWNKIENNTKNHVEQVANIFPHLYNTLQQAESPTLSAGLENN